MTEQEIIKLLTESKYIYAKTMPKFPHFYTLRATWESGEQFEEVVQFIRDKGKAERFFSKILIYFYHDGYKYWSMGSPLKDTILINRAKV
jgi:hypothetical protein